MVANFIVDVLSIPVGNDEALNFPCNFSVNLTFSSSTDYAHNFSHHLSKHCTNLTALTYAHPFTRIPVFWDAVLITG